MFGKKLFQFAFLLISWSVMAAPNSLDLAPEPWRAINDGVMGGVSSGEMIKTEDGLRFQGYLSLDNNGGFASVRRLLDFSLTDAEGIRLLVRGDGRTFQMRIRQDESYDNVAWRAEFATNGKWQTIELLFEDFDPVWRGRSVKDAGPVHAQKVRQIGFLLADGKQKAFRLDIGAIDFLPKN
jgi:hypothetical protein